MMKTSFGGFFGVLSWLLLGPCHAQDTQRLQIVLPQHTDWTTIAEGSSLSIDLRTTAAAPDTLYFSIAQGRLDGMTLDSLGHFAWTPGFELADRVGGVKVVPVLFEVKNQRGESATQAVEFRVLHVNRAPVVGELRPFYVRYRTQNVYKMDPALVHDDDGDPIAYVPISDQMPEGSKLNAQGELTWTLSLNQFNRLKANPQYIEFWVEDQPAKSRTKGRLKIEVTQMDLPPDIAVIPKDTVYRLRENATVNLKFYLSDPNGDDDIVDFGFLADNRQIPKSALVRNTENQYEFIWQPGYDFVKDPYDTTSANLTFYVLDKAQNRSERNVAFVIKNTVNEAEKDRYYYTQYRTALVSAWNLLAQLEEKEEELKRNYRKAKTGKRNRSVVNASLGAITGISPIIGGDNSKYITSVGGTAVATLGTLEATEVIGKPMKDLLDRYNYVTGKKTEIQNKGDVFAREFALKSTRRLPDFTRRLDEYKTSLSLSGLVALELDAGWENKKEATDKAVKRTFKDFAPLEEAQ
jgi:hypothetical protein